jgi:aerobic carbon-monoxide dehydrogenase small subunit
MDTLDLDINMRVNGEDVQARIAPRKTLVDFLRDDLCLTGTHVGCEHGVCGACAVRLDGEVVRGCLVFAVQCDGSRIETIEGLSDSGAIADLQMAFQRRNALQCGYCTPGMLIGAQELLPPAAFPVATQFASISPAIIAAAPDIRRSSMRSSPSRRCARERQADNERTHKTADTVGTRRRA